MSSLLRIADHRSPRATVTAEVYVGRLGVTGISQLSSNDETVAPTQVVPVNHFVAAPVLSLKSVIRNVSTYLAFHPISRYFKK